MRTSISAGPIYAERAQTLGHGRLFVSLARTGLHYETLRGVPLDALPLVFAHDLAPQRRLQREEGAGHPPPPSSRSIR